MKQPSPNWLDYDLRDIQSLMKKAERPSTSASYSYAQPKEKESTNPFDAFKSLVKRNIKSLKKD